MTELALINTASRTAEAPPGDGKHLRLPDQTNARAIRRRPLPAAPGVLAPAEQTHRWKPLGGNEKV
jgi:hypothetical protein